MIGKIGAMAGDAKIWYKVRSVEDLGNVQRFLVLNCNIDTVNDARNDPGDAGAASSLGDAGHVGGNHALSTRIPHCLHPSVSGACAERATAARPYAEGLLSSARLVAS